MRTLLAGVVLAVALLATGCGDDSSSPDGSVSPDGGSAAPSDDVAPGAGDFDRSTLPEGFPTDLIPDEFETGNSTDLGDLVTVGFSSSAPVESSIAFYTAKLGEPETAIEGDPGEFNVQWPPTSDGWIVSVLGGPTESIISRTMFVE